LLRSIYFDYTEFRNETRSTPLYTCTLVQINWNKQQLEVQHESFLIYQEVVIKLCVQIR